jgi:LPXTG-motif cell wall-anchored protein
VQAGETTLAPGEYTVRQISSASNPSVLEFTSDRGTKLAATLTAIPLLQNTPPSETKVVLENQGATSRISKIWVEGEDYGYEFPSDQLVPTQVAVTTMQVRYDAPVLAANTETTTTVAQNFAERTETTTVAPVAPAPQQEEQLIAQRQTNERPEVQTPNSENQPAPQLIAQAPAPSTQQNGPVAQEDRSNESLPATGMGWMAMLIAGIAALAVAGVLRIARVLARSLEV